MGERWPTLREVEDRHIAATLKRYDGDKRRAARALGVSLKTLYNRLHRMRPAPAGQGG